MNNDVAKGFNKTLKRYLNRSQTLLIENDTFDPIRFMMTITYTVVVVSIRLTSQVARQERVAKGQP